MSDEAARILERSFREAPDDPVLARTVLVRSVRFALPEELLLDARATIFGAKVGENLTLANERRRTRTLDAPILARRLRPWFALPENERALRFVVSGGAPTTQARRDHECFTTRVVALSPQVDPDGLATIIVGVETWARSSTALPQGVSEERPIGSIKVDLMTLVRWAARTCAL
jgi:hypothetical protein